MTEPPQPVSYLSFEDLLEITERLGAGPLRDAGLLESAAARPRTTVFGEDAYPTLELKAATLLQFICRNHALVDGNKRLALAATATFLRLNGHPFGLTNDETFNLVMAVAEGTIDVPEIAAGLHEDAE